MPRHQTLHKEIKANVLKLRNHSLVKKIVIGPYENCRHRFTPGVIVTQLETVNGFKMNGYDGSGVYCFYLYLESERARDEVKKYLENFEPVNKRKKRSKKIN